MTSLHFGGKQADDECDDTLKSQKRKVDADTVVWLQVVPMHIVLGNHTDKKMVRLWTYSAAASLFFESGKFLWKYPPCCIDLFQQGSNNLQKNRSNIPRLMCPPELFSSFRLLLIIQNSLWQHTKCNFQQKCCHFVRVPYISSQLLQTAL